MEDNNENAEYTARTSQEVKTQPQNKKETMIFQGRANLKRDVEIESAGSYYMDIS